MKSRYKIIWCLVLAMFYATYSTAQSSDQNYVSVYRNTSPSTAVAEHQYFDGLGRLVEKVSENFSPFYGVDLVETMNYDSFGRVSKKSKTVSVSGNSGKFCSPSQSDYIADYKEPFAYKEYFYEDNPYGRQLLERGPGAAWIMQGKARTTNYLSNTQSSHLSCLNFSFIDGLLTNNNYYPDGSLTVLKTQDEDGRQAYEFRDGEGRLLLSRKVWSNEDIDTYYVYDDKGDLCVVLPPEAANQLKSTASISCNDNDIILQYAYLYEYDALHRCVSKKLPGAEAIHIKYDDANRPIYLQTGLQRAKKLYTTMRYDEFNRLIYKSDGRLQMWNFYDTYDSIPQIAMLSYVPKSGYGMRSNNVKTLQTGSRDFTDDWRVLHTVYYYDIKGQLIQKRSQNILGGYDAYYYLRTYTGNVGRMLHEHFAGGVRHEEIVYYDYDQADRLAMVSHQFDGGPIVRLRQNSYDSLGRLSSQCVFDREIVTYSYNIKDWVTMISSHNFSETLSYNDGNIQQYGGNISALEWRATVGSLNRKYDFRYDDLSRLTNAYYSENGSLNSHYNTYYHYDSMGNMLWMRRNGLQDGGTFGEIDNVYFIYNGNQLVKADNRVESPTYKDAWCFADVPSGAKEYEYDENGNMTRDINKGIIYIEYTFLNLPAYIEFSGGKKISYIYDNKGNKLKAVYQTALPSSELILDYCDNMIYENGELKQVLVDGGYISFTNGKAVYHYYLKDHLGSNRVVVNHDSGEVEQVNHYYPYGGLMAESIGGSVQRFKYNGKELDRMHGLDWYYYGARWYDGTRFLTVDSKANKFNAFSSYIYCLDNPARLIDIDGQAPGDFFKTEEEAALDFGFFYNDNSIRENREYASSIYRIITDSGEKGYSYTIANRGEAHKSVESKPLGGSFVVATVHTHGAYSEGYNDNEFSGVYSSRTGKEIVPLQNSRKGDLGIANSKKLNIYLATPNGSLKKYNYANGKISVLSKSLPSDSNDPSRQNSNSSLVETYDLTTKNMQELYFKQLLNSGTIFK